MGALGPVFRTYEPGRDRLVAVKVFRLDITPEQSRSLADELARAADAGLFHPSIVEPVAAGVEGTAAYRAEEYVAAESLDVALRHYAPAPPAKVLPILTQLAGALDFGRAVGIGHGALHPRDIFVTPDETRVTGFGVVDALERVGLRAPVRRPYSSPERIAGVTWGIGADVFSLAAIAYELLTGRRPAGTGDQIGPLSGFARADVVRAVLARGMAEDPASRYETALAFAADLEAAARAGRTTPAAAVPPIEPGVAPASATAVPTAAPTEGPVRSPDLPQSDSVDREADDVVAERDEDEALALYLREQAPEDESLELQPSPAGREAEPHDSTRADADHGIPFGSAELTLSDRVEEGPPSPRPAAEAPHASVPRGEVAEPPVVPVAATRATDVTPRGAPRFFDVTDVPAPYRPLAHDDVPAADLRSSERVRPVMLPVAVAAIVCLLLGYAVGYVVGSRNVPASVAETPAPMPTRDAGAEVGSPPAAQTPAAGTQAPEPADPAPPAERASVPPSGRLVVRSRPAGASVTVNGEWRGRTPVTLDRLALGQYAVRVVQPGFEVAQQELTLSSGNRSRTIDVTLRRQQAAAPASTPRRSAPAAASGTSRGPAAPAAFSGSVYVDSRPRGARVFINGKEVGTTPMRVPDVAIGSHVVRLELPDHRTWTASVRVAAGEETRVSGSLDPLR